MRDGKKTGPRSLFWLQQQDQDRNWYLNKSLLFCKAGVAALCTRFSVGWRGGERESHGESSVWVTGALAVGRVKSCQCYRKSGGEAAHGGKNTKECRRGRQERGGIFIDFVGTSWIKLSGPRLDLKRSWEESHR